MSLRVEHYLEMLVRILNLSPYARFLSAHAVQTIAQLTQLLIELFCKVSGAIVTRVADVFMSARTPPR